MLSDKLSNSILQTFPELAHWEARLHILQLLSLLYICDSEVNDLWGTVVGQTQDSNKLIRAWAHNGLHEIALQFPLYKEKASELFKSYFHEDINKIIGENPLPMGGRYDIATDYRNSNKMRRMVQEIRRLEGVDVASFQQGIISRVDSIVENILGISMVFGIVIFIIAVILVSNTIRLIIHAKKETIETMHLLGATNSFIRFPFVVEGIIQGVLGAGFSLLILVSMLNCFK